MTSSTRSTPLFVYGLRAKVAVDRLSADGSWLALSDDFVDALNERAAKAANHEPDPQDPYDPEWKALKAERDAAIALLQRWLDEAAHFPREVDYNARVTKHDTTSFLFRVTQ